MPIAVELVAVFFLLMGLYALVAPGRVLSLFGVAVTTVDGRSEVRAVYGGFGVAMSVLLLVAGATIRDGVLACLAVALLGMAGGRVVAALLDGGPGVFPWLFGGVEVAMAVALLWAR
jgi:hypothetical protein